MDRSLNSGVVGGARAARAVPGARPAVALMGPRPDDGDGVEPAVRVRSRRWGWGAEQARPASAQWAASGLTTRMTQPAEARPSPKPDLSRLSIRRRKQNRRIIFFFNKTAG